MPASATSSRRHPASATETDGRRIDWYAWRPTEDATLLFSLPFERMRADDAHWLPLLLAGRQFDDDSCSTTAR